MPYDDSTDSGAAEDLDAAPSNESESETEPTTETFLLPDDFSEANTYKPGDTFTVRIVGKTPDGQLEAECVHDEKPTDWKQDMRDTMGPNMDGNTTT